MPVYKIQNEMPYDELVKWVEFFKRRPVGWRDDQRTYLLLRSQGLKQNAEAIFPSLKLMAQQAEKKQIPDKAVPKGKFLDMMLKAKNGDGSHINLGGSNGKNKS